MSVCVQFYVLDEADRGNSRSLWVGADGTLTTDHPPVIGDMIDIVGAMTDPEDDRREMVKIHGAYRVVDRRWMPAAYGSMSWPGGRHRQLGNTLLDVMLAQAPEFFAQVERE